MGSLIAILCATITLPPDCAKQRSLFKFGVLIDWLLGQWNLRVVFVFRRIRYIIKVQCLPSTSAGAPISGLRLAIPIYATRSMPPNACSSRPGDNSEVDLVQTIDRKDEIRPRTHDGFS